MIAKLQYLIGIIIAGFFGLGIIPLWYYFLFPFLVTLLIIQIIISFCRFRFLSVVICGFLLTLSLLSLIPFAGVIFRVLGLFLAIFDLNEFKYEEISPRGKFTFFNTKKQNFNEKPNLKKKKEFKDANFSEK